MSSGSSFVLKGGVLDERQEEEEAQHSVHHDILKNRSHLFEVLARAKAAKAFSYRGDFKSKEFR